MSLALFDLDNTLLGGDSDYLWGEFLADIGAVDATSHRRENARFLAAYNEGTLDGEAFLRFQLAPLASNSLADLESWQQQFTADVIEPIVLSKGLALIDEHKAAGHIPVVVTSTNSFITRPITDLLGIEHLLATEPEYLDGRFTGKVLGIRCFQAGKVERVENWAAIHGLDLDDSWAYSDSVNDLPLLESVTHPVAVDADQRLSDIAQQRGWDMISLR